MGRNIPSKSDTASLEEQGWNLGTAKAEGWEVLKGAVIWGEPRALSHLWLNHNIKVSHTHPGEQANTPHLAQKTRQQRGH